MNGPELTLIGSFSEFENSSGSFVLVSSIKRAREALLNLESLIGGEGLGTIGGVTGFTIWLNRP